MRDNNDLISCFAERTMHITMPYEQYIFVSLPLCLCLTFLFFFLSVALLPASLPFSVSPSCPFAFLCLTYLPLYLSLSPFRFSLSFSPFRFSLSLLPSPLSLSPFLFHGYPAIMRLRGVTAVLPDLDCRSLTCLYEIMCRIDYVFV